MTNTPTPARPAKDEWGVYDPQHAGFAALFARIDARATAVSAGPKTKDSAVFERPSLCDAK